MLQTDKAAEQFKKTNKLEAYMRSPIMRNAIIFLVMFFLSTVTHAQTRQVYNVYKDDSAFVMQYPADWSIVPLIQQNDRLRLVRNNMAYTDFMLVMTYLDGFKNIKTPAETKEAMKQFDPQVFLKQMREGLPDARLVDNGKIYLSQRDAAYMVYEYTYRAVGVEVPIKQLQIITVKDGYMYTLAFRTAKEQYNNMFPIFQLMAGGFSFK